MRKEYNERVLRSRIIETIQVEFNRGQGTDEDPVRRVYRYYSTKGEFLGEVSGYDGDEK